MSGGCDSIALYWLIILQFPFATPTGVTHHNEFTFPEVLTPLKRQTNTMTQANSKKPNNSHCMLPMTSMLPVKRKTLFLKYSIKEFQNKAK